MGSLQPVVVVLILTYQIGEANKVQLPIEKCGESLANAIKIVNGTDAEIGDHPWMAAIGYVDSRNTLGNSDTVWKCGGSLITFQHVLTAAHCLDPSITHPFQLSKVRVKELDLNDPNDGAPHEEVNVDRIIWHPDFDNLHKINDIGLIRLKKKLEYHALYLVPICLPAADLQYNDYINKNVMVAGWGRTGVKAGDTWLSASKLQLTNVNIRDLSECRNNFTSVQKLRHLIIDNRVVCASAPGTDACKGDSGGPLMLFTRSSGTKRAKMYIFGVVSYGYGCAKEGFPGIYTRVSTFINWIVENL